MGPRVTIGQAVAAASGVLVAALAALLLFTASGSRHALQVTSERLRDAHTQRIASDVAGYLREATRSLDDLRSASAQRACDVDDPSALERCFAAMLQSRENLSEISLTRARLEGDDEGGAPVLARSGRWQLAVCRETPDPASRLWTRWIREEAGRFVALERDPLAPGQAFARRKEAAADPTDHPTFTTPASAAFRGRWISSDLSYSQLDAALPEPQRRVVLTLLGSLVDRTGAFVGVMRLSLGTSALDRRLQDESARNAPHTVFLCDAAGRLVSRLGAGARLVETADEALRVDPASAPPQVVAALSLLAGQGLDAEHPLRSGRVEQGGETWLASFRSLPESQGWAVGIVVPESHYLGELNAILRRLALASAAVVALMLAGALGAMRVMRSGLRRLQGEIVRIRGFEFSASRPDARFKDVNDALESLEQAKTALRAMSRYVPVGLVRRLFESNADPRLGGELREVSLLFSDIEGFTTLAESTPPGELSEMLGRYFDVMTRCVHERAGTVDKYVGDAVMAFWNAPGDVPDHAAQACLAAVAIQAALADLQSSPEWAGRPRLTTRVGVHVGTVMVGNFGSHDRLNYTAIGDAVNLASRLEGLNKQYGTRLIASDAVVAAAGDAIETRRLDRVAVKGKTQGVLIRELLGRRGEVEAPILAAARAYERAFDLYLARDFAAAASLLGEQPHDAPARVLLGRCHDLLSHPPAPDWNGVWAATSK